MISVVLALWLPVRNIKIEPVVKYLVVSSAYWPKLRQGVLGQVAVESSFGLT